jgi:hypothetical protein
MPVLWSHYPAVKPLHTFAGNAGLFGRIILPQNRYALLLEMLYQQQKASVTHCAGKTEDC